MKQDMPLTAWVNGHFVPLDEATVHIEDRGFQFADGVYEVIACFGGTFLDLDAHIKRLQRSCDAIAITLPRPPNELESLIQQTYTLNPFDHAMIYVQITRGVAPRAHLVKKHLQPTLVITVRELSEPAEEKLAHGTAGITRPDLRWKRCDIKSIALLASVLGKQEAEFHGVDETFWLDEQGHLLEGCATNCFAMIDRKLVTHPLDHQVLGGITRAMLLRLARRHGLQIEERPWKLSEAGLTECMMTSTTNVVMPVCRMNGKAIGNGAPGPATLKLRQWMLDEFESLKR
jgi:D-alanine transaminase